MSDLPEVWTNVQGMVMYTIGIVSVILIFLGGIFGGWLGWRWSKDELGIKNSRARKLLLALIPLVIVGLLFVGATRGINFIGRLMSSPTVRLTPSTNQVTITTDKIEYKQGEGVKINVKNGLENPICFESCMPYWLEKKNWNWHLNVESTRRCETNYIEECLEPGDTRLFGVQTSWSGYKKEPGTYRAVISLCISCIVGEAPRRDKTIYSNEFTIKEK